MARSKAFWRTSTDNMRKMVTGALIEKTSKSAKRLFDLVVEFSPVDSGAYRDSWTLSVGKPVFRFDERSHAALRGAVNPLPPPRRPRLTTRPFTKFYISNGSPYAHRIEDGHSGQAPNGVIRKAVRALKGQVF